MYPEVRSLVPNLEQDVLESYEEHQVADVLTAESARMDSTDEHFQARITVLTENVTSRGRRGAELVSQGVGGAGPQTAVRDRGPDG
jgi:hypothetical protein